MKLITLFEEEDIFRASFNSDVYNATAVVYKDPKRSDIFDLSDRGRSPVYVIIEPPNMYIWSSEGKMLHELVIDFVNKNYEEDGISPIDPRNCICGIFYPALKYFFVTQSNMKIGSRWYHNENIEKQIDRSLLGTYIGLSIHYFDEEENGSWAEMWDLGDDYEDEPIKKAVNEVLQIVAPNKYW